MATVTGIVLAAGAGTRMGRPKALISSPDGTPWLHSAVAVLTEAGCDPVLVILGAESDAARPLVPAGATVVVAEDWAEGMSASLRAGLRAATGDAALITLVDLPELPVAVALRLVAAGTPRNALRQAVFDGEPGHPVLIGSDHWAGVADSISGDRGARQYLVANGADEVECGDLFSGADVDRPERT